MSSFFQKLTYNNFQLFADRYVADIPDPLEARQGQDALPPPDPGEQIFNLPKKSHHAASSPTAGNASGSIQAFMWSFMSI